MYLTSERTVEKEWKKIDRRHHIESSSNFFNIISSSFSPISSSNNSHVYPLLATEKEQKSVTKQLPAEFYHFNSTLIDAGGEEKSDPENDNKNDIKEGVSGTPIHGDVLPNDDPLISNNGTIDFASACLIVMDDNHFLIGETRISDCVYISTSICSSIIL